MVPLAQVTGIVLAGGRSFRFGAPKTRAPWKGSTLLDAAVKGLREMFNEVLVVGKNPEEAGFVGGEGVLWVSDGKNDFHPLSGLRAGLEASPTPWAFVRAGDMPFIRKSLVDYLMERAGVYHAVVPVWGDRPQPFCAAYSRRILPSLMDGGGRVRDVLDGCDVLWVGEPELRERDPEGLSFFDIDTPRDYADAQNILRR